MTFQIQFNTTLGAGIHKLVVLCQFSKRKILLIDVNRLNTGFIHTFMGPRTNVKISRLLYDRFFVMF